MNKTSFCLRIRTLGKELGLFPFLTYTLARALAKVSRHIHVYHYLFYAQPVRATPRVATSRAQRYQITCLENYDSILGALHRPKAVIENRFSQGAVCLVLSKDAVFLGCIWLIRTQYQEDEIRALYSFGDNIAWDFDVYVIPERRLSPVFAILWDCADEWMSEHHVQWSLSRISAHNPHSVRSHTSAGATYLAWAVCITCGHWQFSIASQSPRIYFSSCASSASGPNWRFVRPA